MKWLCNVFLVNSTCLESSLPWSGRTTFSPRQINKSNLSQVENSPTFSHCLVVAGYRSLRCKCADRGHKQQNKWARDLKGAFAKEWPPDRLLIGWDLLLSAELILGFSTRRDENLGMLGFNTKRQYNNNRRWGFNCCFLSESADLCCKTVICRVTIVCFLLVIVSLWNHSKRLFFKKKILYLFGFFFFKTVK